MENSDFDTWDYNQTTVKIPSYSQSSVSTEQVLKITINEVGYGISNQDGS
jgi:hypothetical protein